jgi:hypothetical protein
MWRRVNFDDDDMDLASYDIAPKAKGQEGKADSKPKPSRISSVPIDDATIDADFFQWSNYVPEASAM